jgi:hypothetical protein
MAEEGAKRFSHVSSNKFAALLPCRSHPDWACRFEFSDGVADESRADAKGKQLPMRSAKLPTVLAAAPEMFPHQKQEESLCGRAHIRRRQSVDYRSLQHYKPFHHAPFYLVGLMFEPVGSAASPAMGRAPANSYCRALVENSAAVAPMRECQAGRTTA